ncbi:MAG TPA: isoprenylcysteine carboxylmethyltransferase family protein [Bryobacteraceae bacterium]|nr:isoprenylcysteine carboxylmethyltransferase family protein [Bryobacteraceae bacterium]
MFIVKLIASVLLNVLIFGVPLFLPAGTLDWWRAWVIVSLSFVGATGAIASLAREHRGVLEERMKSPIQRGQPFADKILVLLLLITFLGILVVSSLDVFRFHLMSKPAPLVSSLGLALTMAGWWIAYLALRENAFAALVVKRQEERGQIVIDTGVYAVVRHPMYAGGSLLLIGIPLWLESYAGALIACLAVATLVVRISLEERFLRRELAGYQAYASRVRYRLIPLVW